MDPVVVIGSGMSGAAVAGVLSRRNVPVLVVEAGPNVGRGHVAASEATRSWLEPANDPHFRPLRATQPAQHYGIETGLRWRVGGRSLYWRGIALRLEDYALADWPAEISLTLQNEGYAEMEEHLAAWTGAALDAPRSDAEISLLAMLHRLGCVNASPTPRAVRYLPSGGWAAYSPIEEVQPEQVLAEHALIDVTSRAERLEVILLGRKGRIRQPASAVVLCAGAIENARLVTVLTGHDGPYPIVDHHAQGWLCVRPPWPEATGGEASILVDRNLTAHFNSFIELHQIDGQVVADAWTMGELLPHLGTHVQFAPRDAAMHLIVDERPGDEVLKTQRLRLIELQEVLGLRPGSAVDDAGDFSTALRRALSNPGVTFPYRCPLGTTDHDACTLPLGSSLVDPTGQLRAIPGIFVAGPSLFPRPGAANPSLTTLALSRYVASCVHAALQ